MKKHILVILVLALILSVVGVSVFFVVKHNRKQSLYKAHSEFIYSSDTSKLTNNILAAEELYQTKVSSVETRLTILHSVIAKLDTFETDLNARLVLLSSNSSKSNNLSKKHQTLSSARSILINSYDEYITRMSGNTSIEGPAVKDLYNEIFDETTEFIYKYNSCFVQTSNFVLNNVYKAESIKSEMYSLYSAGITHLLNNISNHQFSNINTISMLNNGIQLSHNNIKLKDSVSGGEFSQEALNFKKYFSQSNIDELINNFHAYYTSTINPSIEQSNEKLTVHYLKQILEI